jgi:hypothetical protein
MTDQSFFNRLEVYLRREWFLLLFHLRSSWLLWRQHWVRDARQNASGSHPLVELIIPFPAAGRLSANRHDYYFKNLRKLMLEHLPKQIYANFLATVYCDGENSDVKTFLEICSDRRFRYKATDGGESNWGHIQTRKGIEESEADFVVRMNCDNEPFSDYLEILVQGALSDAVVIYARVIYRGAAAREHFPSFADYPNEFGAFILPKDMRGSLEFRNIDCMNYMVRSAAAKKHAYCWGNNYAADWQFIEEIMKDSGNACFMDRIIGYKR